MIIRSSVFVKSSSRLKQCPEPVFPEYAFIGRSNVGKSSLINMLVNKKAMAKTSATPGKTQLINHYLINGEWYLADLPGIGYAKVALQTRKEWNYLISEYLLKRKNLVNAFLLVDARIKLQQIDLDLMTELYAHDIPFSIVFTKTDKLKTQELDEKIRSYIRSLPPELTVKHSYFVTSAASRKGRAQILEYISETNSLFTTQT